MKSLHRFGVVVVAVLALLGLTVGTAAAQDGAPAGPSAVPAVSTPPAGPPQFDILSAGLWAALNNPMASPPGANDYTCKPTTAHPRPVVLVHGTFGNAYDTWSELSPQLRAAGYCVFALNYGGAPGFLFQGLGDVAASAAQLGTFIDGVLAATGSSTVDLVGHSQGGMMPRYYIQNLNGAGKVHQLIGLSPSNHGTDFFGLTQGFLETPFGAEVINAFCPACIQQIAGSDFITSLNANGETVPGVLYTVLQTRYDDVVTPYASAFLAPASNVTNVTIQDVCGLDFTDHIGIPYDPITLRLVQNALDPATAGAAGCFFVPPVVS